MLLTVTPTSTIHTERIVEFPLQQWLRECVTVLHYIRNSHCLYTKASIYAVVVFVKK
jgi:hypothetical protein